MDYVYYLIKSQNKSSELVFPEEEDIDNYYGFGAFYLMDSGSNIPAAEYRFPAILNERLIVTTASLYRDARRFYSIQVENIGTFIFHAQSLSNKYRYSGQNPQLANKVAFWRFRSWNPGSLETACKQHNFYFVGASPRTGFD